MPCFKHNKLELSVLSVCLYLQFSCLFRAWRTALGGLKIVLYRFCLMHFTAHAVDFLKLLDQISHLTKWIKKCFII